MTGTGERRHHAETERMSGVDTKSGMAAGDPRHAWSKQPHEHMTYDSNDETARPVRRPAEQAAGRPADTAPLIVS